LHALSQRPPLRGGRDNGAHPAAQRRFSTDGRIRRHAQRTPRDRHRVKAVEPPPPLIGVGQQHADDRRQPGSPASVAARNLGPASAGLPLRGKGAPALAEGVFDVIGAATCPRSALSGEVGVTPEMLVAPAEQVSGPSIRFPGSTDRALPLHEYTGHAGSVAASQQDRWHDHRAGGAAHVLASVPDTGQRRASRTGVSAGRTGRRASASEARLWRLGTPAVRTSPVLGVLFLSWHVYGCTTERADWSGAPACTRGWRDEVPGTSVRGFAACSRDLADAALRAC